MGTRAEIDCINGTSPFLDIYLQYFWTWSSRPECKYYVGYAWWWWCTCSEKDDKHITLPLFDLHLISYNPIMAGFTISSEHRFLHKTSRSNIKSIVFVETETKISYTTSRLTRHTHSHTYFIYAPDYILFGTIIPYSFVSFKNSQVEIRGKWRKP